MRAAQRLAGVLRASAQSTVRSFAAEAAPAASQAPEGVGYVAQVCLELDMNSRSMYLYQCLHYGQHEMKQHIWTTRPAWTGWSPKTVQ